MFPEPPTLLLTSTKAGICLMSTLYGRYHHLRLEGEASAAHRARFPYPTSRLLSDRAGIRTHEVGDGSTRCMFLPVPLCVTTAKVPWISWPSYYNVPPNSEEAWDSASVTSGRAGGPGPH